MTGQRFKGLLIDCVRRMRTAYVERFGFYNTKNLRIHYVKPRGVVREYFRAVWMHESYFKYRTFETFAEAAAYLEVIREEYYPAEKTF
jgi:hypothetical protein